MRRLHLKGDDEEDVNEPQTSSVPTWLTSPSGHATNIITRKSTSEKANESEWCWASYHPRVYPFPSLPR
ncbi:hypothetical protein GWK47_017891 [Chionoecetes opilio]|uniref:Uncharacterized protein n=1 Tax=Chionoecetes opilio TaxID=41210 RepID=A0A8J5CGV4_CHIOP|nr:hypothetical protein GWK47_017891 [Chionoecetes opilio]